MSAFCCCCFVAIVPVVAVVAVVVVILVVFQKLTSENVILDSYILQKHNENFPTKLKII